MIENDLRKRAEQGHSFTVAGVKRITLRLLKERIDNSSLTWKFDWEKPDEFVAAELLKGARYMTQEGWITLEGVDYYRRETMRFKMVAR